MPAIAADTRIYDLQNKTATFFELRDAGAGKPTAQNSAQATFAQG